MREIDDNFDTSFDDFSYISEVDKKAEKIKRNKMNYKDRRNLVAVSKVRVDDEKIYNAILQAREDFIKKTGAIPRLFGVQNTILLLLSSTLENVKSIEDVIELNFERSKEKTERFITVSFPKQESEMYNKIVFLTEQNRKRYKLPIKAFGVSNMILLLISNELIRRGYLK